MKISLDDFGTGYASLTHLKSYPIDQVKIDRSFISGITDGPRDAAIVETVLALARTLGISAVAEGVETIGQRDCLARLRCEYVQGYLFGKAMPLDELGRRFALERRAR